MRKSSTLFTAFSLVCLVYAGVARAADTAAHAHERNRLFKEIQSDLKTSGVQQIFEHNCADCHNSNPKFTAWYADGSSLAIQFGNEFEKATRGTRKAVLPAAVPVGGAQAEKGVEYLVENSPQAHRERGISILDMATVFPFLPAKRDEASQIGVLKSIWDSVSPRAKNPMPIPMYTKIHGDLSSSERLQIQRFVKSSVKKLEALQGRYLTSGSAEADAAQLTQSCAGCHAGAGMANFSVDNDLIAKLKNHTLSLEKAKEFYAKVDSGSMREHDAGGKVAKILDRAIKSLDKK